MKDFAKALIVVLSFITWTNIGVFGQDYSRYKNQEYTIPSGNPAYLATNGRGGGMSEFPAINGKQVFPLNLVATIPLGGEILAKLNKAEREKDGYILFYQRIGQYVDRSKFKGIEYDRNVQLEYINAISKAYTFKADAILLYSEFMPKNLTQEEISMLINEDFPSVYSEKYDKNEKNFIFNAFMNGGANAVNSYITHRLNPATNEEDFKVALTNDGNGVVIKSYEGKLDRITIPAIIQGIPVKEIGEEAFKYYNGFTSPPYTHVTIPEGVTIIRAYAFRMCNKLQKVELPSTLKIIEERAFEGCSNLSFLNIPNGIKTIGNYAFDYCPKLNINIPESILAKNTTIHNIFTGTGIKNMVIPEGITIIGHNAFKGCIELETITLPNTILEIHSYAFDGCINLVSVTIPDSVNSIKFYISGSSGDFLKGCKKLNLASQAALKKRGYIWEF